MNDSNRNRPTDDPGPLVRIVDDEESLRKALARLLESAGYEVASYGSAGDFLLDDDIDRPGCLVLDVNMPGPSGLELQEALTRRNRELPIIFVTGHGDIPMSVQAIKRGAVDFLTKPVKSENLFAAVQAALDLDESTRRENEQAALLLARFESLTPRERAVFDCVISGMLNKQAAAKLHMAERTVKAHRARIMEKMQARSLAELVQMAERLGDRTGPDPLEPAS